MAERSMASSSNATRDLPVPAPPEASRVDFAALTSVIRESINPGAHRRDRDLEPLDRTFFAELAATGVMSEPLPRAVGGAGPDWVRRGQILRWMAHAVDELAVPFILSIQQSLAMQLWRSGRPELIRRYLQPMIRGERFSSFCWTEGSDPFSFETQVLRDGGEWVVTGEKG